MKKKNLLLTLTFFLMFWGLLYLFTPVNSYLGLLLLPLCCLFSGRVRAEEPSPRATSILSSLKQPLLCLDSHGTVEYVNPAFLREFGYCQEDVKGKKIDYFIPVALDEQWQPGVIDHEYKKIKLLTANKTTKEVYCSAASVIDEQGYLQGAVLTFACLPQTTPISGGGKVNKTEPLLNKEIEFKRIKDELYQEKIRSRNLEVELEQKDKQLKRIACRDQLTGLLNRRGFCERAQEKLELFRNIETRAGVVYIDLDRFKYINDRFGYEIGDSLLQRIADRLHSLTTEDDLLARPGGDEFILLLARSDEEKTAARVEQILQQIAVTFEIGERDISVSVSSGISIFPEHGVELDELLQNADIAMYNAKERVEDFKVYSEQMGLTVRERFLKNDLKRALEAEEFYLVYQPFFNVVDNEVAGVEALLRWEHPELGKISPGEFIPLAEETRLIIPIGEWVLREACLRCKKWQQTKNSSLSVSVNISVNQLLHQGFAQNVETILQETGLEAQYLVLEVVENISAHNKRAARKSLENLKQIGVKIALDDFGSGFSSLAYIKNFPIDNLKIDRSFIKGISANKKEQEIIANIIGMAHNLDMTVVGEGVEEGHEFDFLSENGCDIVQGYFLARPDRERNIEQQIFS